MLPSSVPDLTAQIDMNKKMLLTDEENSEKFEDKHCTMQNIEMFDSTTHNTPASSMLPFSTTNLTIQPVVLYDEMQSLFQDIGDEKMRYSQHTMQHINMYDRTKHDTPIPPMLPSSTIDLTTQSDTDSQLELMNEFIMKDNNKTMKQNYSIMQNAEMQDKTNTRDTSTPSMLPSSIIDLTTQSAYTSNYSTLNHQINNASSGIYSEQIPNNVSHEVYLDTVPNTPNNRYQLTTIKKTHEAVITSIVANYTNVTTDSSKASQNHKYYAIASMEQLVRHVSKRVSTSMSALEVSPCTSADKHCKTDSDQHPIGNPKLQCPESQRFFDFKSHL